MPPLLPTQLESHYRAHHGWLAHWLQRRLGNAFDAADLMQDTFIRLLAGAPAQPQTPATTRGVEAEVSGQLRPDWQLTASYAYSRIRNAAGARIQTSQPQSMAKLWTTWRLAQGVPGLVLGGGVNWQSDIYMDDRGPHGERFTQKAYAVAGLMAQYQVSAQLLATLNVNNVFDKQYYSTGMGGYYGDPRNAMLSLRYQF
ncbi:TonB-dependent receptor domain-containing protein [Janthinobacterium sp. UMAB-60]|uniref:TonB-dependent receptor domain-containing protein n=1 Tax=Janthinobacterium sp. UMAB-60 TaxID=1365365 RepID=UPI001C59BAE7|nr:TonB-dependent receptor [Janthinobacterium sp. UMAB-60]